MKIENYEVNGNDNNYDVGNDKEDKDNNNNNNDLIISVSTGCLL